MIAWSAGLILRKFGGDGRLVGNWPDAAVIAVCTSSAAPSMLRSRSNCRTICVVPSEFVEVICDRPGISENWRSSGCATLDAIVSGFAPGRLAETWIVGKSTCGSGATGSSGQTAAPTSRIAIASSEVPIGRLMKMAETPRLGVSPDGSGVPALIAFPLACRRRCRPARAPTRRVPAGPGCRA